MGTSPYYCVSDDDDGCVSVDTRDGALASFTYRTPDQRAKARLRAEDIAENEAQENGGVWGCNY